MKKTVTMILSSMLGAALALGIQFGIAQVTTNPSVTGAPSPSVANITSGTINGTTIGATTKAAGAFTTLTATGTSTLAAVNASSDLSVAATKKVYLDGGVNTYFYESSADVITAVRGGSPVLVLDGNFTVESGGNASVYGLFVLGTTRSPASGAACTAGTLDWDSGFLYVCTATGVSKRVAITGGY